MLHSFAWERTQVSERGLMFYLYHLGKEDMYLGPIKFVKSQICKVSFLFPYLSIRLLNHLVKR